MPSQLNSILTATFATPTQQSPLSFRRIFGVLEIAVSTNLGLKPQVETTISVQSPLYTANDAIDLSQPQLPLLLSLLSRFERFPELRIELYDPRLLFFLTVLHTRQHADEIFNLLRFEQKILGQFPLRGRDCGGGVGTLIRWVRGGFGLLLLGSGLLVVVGISGGITVVMVEMGVSGRWDGEGGGSVVEG